MSNTETVVPKGYELKKKKPIFKRVWFWLLAIIALIIVITVASSGGGESTVSGGASNGGDSTGGDSAAPAGPTFQGQQEGDITAEPGQTITVDDVAITSTPLAEGDASVPPCARR